MVNKKLSLIGLALVLMVFLTAATTYFLFPYDPKDPPEADDRQATVDGMNSVSEANNMFAFELFDELVESEDDNIFYSPYSIFSALAMTYEGSSGETAKEMQDVFHFQENDVLRPNFAAVYNRINEGDKKYELRTGNALWVREDFPLLEEYTDNVEKYYGGKGTNLDFASDVEGSRETINSFIEEQTSGRIENLIPKGALNPMTALVLTNAVYFKGNWQFEFNEEDTLEEDFYVSPDETVKVDMMNMRPDEEKFNYTETDNLQMIELPYEGGELSMYVLLPDEGFDSIEEELTNEYFEGLLDDLQETEFNTISIPRFSFETKYTMNNVLSDMGMPSAFDENLADFSGMTGDVDLFISSVIHKAFIEVNEEGTEAAGATGVVIMPTSAPADPPKNFRADSPFVFVIRDNELGVNLFTGKVKNPIE